MTTRALRPPGRSTASSTPHLIIRPRGRFTPVDLAELWAFRDLIATFAIRDIRLRYRQTALGIIWVVLQPLLGALIFTFVFGRVAHLPSEGVPYIVFAYVGLLGWNVFSGIVTRASASLTSAGSMVSKIYFPRLALPLSVLGSVLLDFAIALVVQAGFLLAYGVDPGWHIALLPVWLLLTIGLATGLGLATSALAARYRDIQYIVPLLLQLLTFASPVGYSVANIPQDVRWTAGINPLTGILQGFRWSLLGRGSISFNEIVLSAAAAVGSLVIGVIVFTSMERELADVI